MKLEFVGDWDESDARAIAQTIKTSLKPAAPMAKAAPVVDPVVDECDPVADWSEYYHLGIPDPELSKSASSSRRATFSSRTALHGSPLVRTGAPALDRVLVRNAIQRCKLDGLSFDGIEVCLEQGKPDFLPGMVHAYCLPPDGRICLAPHDPSSAIASLCKQWSARLKSGVSAGVVAAMDALDVLGRVSSLTLDAWIESLIKQYYGAIQCDRAWAVLGGGEPPSQYLALLVARGAKH